MARNKRAEPKHLPTIVIPLCSNLKIKRRPSKWFFVVVVVSRYLVFSFGKITNPQLLLPPRSDFPQPMFHTQSQLIDAPPLIIAGAAKPAAAEAGEWRCRGGSVWLRPSPPCFLEGGGRIQVHCRWQGRQRVGFGGTCHQRTCRFQSRWHHHLWTEEQSSVILLMY